MCLRAVQVYSWFVVKELEELLNTSLMYFQLQESSAEAQAVYWMDTVTGITTRLPQILLVLVNGQWHYTSKLAQQVQSGPGM